MVGSSAAKKGRNKKRLRQRRGGGGRVGCGRPCQRRLVGSHAGGRRRVASPHCQFWQASGPGPNPPDQPHSEKRPTEVQAKGPVPKILL